MKTRTYNILTGLTVLVVCLIGAISIRNENVSELTRYAVWAAVVVSSVMVLRTGISSWMLHLQEKRDKAKETDKLYATSTDDEEEEDPDELIEIAVAMHRERRVAENYLDWMSSHDKRRIDGANVILAKITDAYDGDGNADGYWLCYVGTRSAYHQLKEELTNATVADWWPNPYGPGEDDSLLDEYDFTEEEGDDVPEPAAEDLPGDGN